MTISAALYAAGLKAFHIPTSILQWYSRPFLQFSLLQ